jgi:hypothetical protein
MVKLVNFNAIVSFPPLNRGRQTSFGQKMRCMLNMYGRKIVCSVFPIVFSIGCLYAQQTAFFIAGLLVSALRARR